MRSTQPPWPATGVLVLAGPIARGDVPILCARLRLVLRESGAGVVVCDVGGLAANVAAVDALARLQLTARRERRRIRLRHVSRELGELLAFVGLCDVLGAGPGSGLEPGRQAEERKQPPDVEKRVDRDDVIP